MSDSFCDPMDCSPPYNETGSQNPFKPETYTMFYVTYISMKLDKIKLYCTTASLIWQPFPNFGDQI